MRTRSFVHSAFRLACHCRGNSKHYARRAQKYINRVKELGPGQGKAGWEGRGQRPGGMEIGLTPPRLELAGWLFQGECHRDEDNPILDRLWTAHTEPELFVDGYGIERSVHSDRREVWSPMTANTQSTLEQPPSESTPPTLDE